MPPRSCRPTRKALRPRNVSPKWPRGKYHQSHRPTRVVVSEGCTCGGKTWHTNWETSRCYECVMAWKDYERDFERFDKWYSGC